MEKNIKKTSNRLYLFVSLLFYKIIIEVIYLQVISPMYEYYGLITNPDILKLFLSTIYFIVFFFSIPSKEKYVSTSIYVMIGIFLLIPSLSYYWLSSQSDLYTLCITLCMLIISFILKFRRIYIIDNFKYARPVISLIFTLYFVFSVLIVISQGGFDARSLSFDTIYSLREDLQVSTSVGYILNWCVKVFTPFFFAYFYYKRKYWSMSFVLLIQLALYLTFGYKAYLFSIAFLLLCLFINKFSNFNANFSLYYTLINVISILIYKTIGISEFLNSIPFRMVFVPAQSQYQYFDFFKVNPKVHFADGLIGTLLSIKSPYPMSMFNVISNAYYGDLFSQNTGIFGDAYGNGGIMAMVIISIILGITLYIIDITTTNVPNIITISAFSYMIFVLNDNSLLTALLTGGLGLLIVLFYFFNSELETTKKVEKHTEDLKVENFWIDKEI